MSRLKEYEMLSSLEQQTTQMRHQTFTALIAISFLLPGFAVQASSVQRVEFLTTSISASQLSFLLGFLFYLFTIFHYAWYHRYSHRYRARLKMLEQELGIMIYSIRSRPKWRRAKFHFDWLLYILGLFYWYATGVYVGFALAAVVVGLLLFLYSLLLVWSVRWPDEPLEH